jgi:hypothetical protein
VLLLGCSLRLLGWVGLDAIDRLSRAYSALDVLEKSGQHRFGMPASLNGSRAAPQISLRCGYFAETAGGW